MFATHGIPEVITLDNVPSGSSEFAAWYKQMGIKHRKITPLWPAAKLSGLMKLWKRTTEFVFLMNYRNTPQIPQLDRSRSSKVLQTVRANDNRRKSKANTRRLFPIFARRSSTATSSTTSNTLTTRYDPRPFTVLSKRESVLNLPGERHDYSGIYPWYRK